MKYLTFILLNTAYLLADQGQAVLISKKMNIGGSNIDFDEDEIFQEPEGVAALSLEEMEKVDS